MDMFLTKECDYGVRIVRGLSDGKPKAVPELCEEENIPRQFAYKILKKLEKSGIVESFRGRAGGYRLTKKTDELTLLDVARATDTDAFVFECMKAGNKCPRRTSPAGCAVHEEFCRIQAMMTKAMAERSLAEILKKSYTAQ
jgi:Rrf2 family protein